MKSGITLYAAAYRSFRAPTLNELYRSFRVGNVLTQSNPYLKAEHFSGAEGGVKATLSLVGLQCMEVCSGVTPRIQLRTSPSAAPNN
jgi:outer membrane cobalamin receptor